MDKPKTHLLPIAVGLVALALSISAVAVFISFVRVKDSRLTFAAEYLCPIAPETVLKDLRVFADSGISTIGVASTEGPIRFYLYKDRVSGKRVLSPATQEAVDYQASLPVTCFDGPEGRPTPRQVP